MQTLTLIIITLGFWAVRVECGDLFKEGYCATLYSESDYNGAALEFRNFDQSINLKRDYLHSLEGWHKTGSVQVAKGCRVELGYKENLKYGIDYQYYSNTSRLTPLIPAAAECFCESLPTVCSCKDVKFPRDLNPEAGHYGRAYRVASNCNHCNAYYIRLDKHFANNMQGIREDKFTAFAAPEGCTLYVYEKPNQKGSRVIINGAQLYSGSARSYSLNCPNATGTPKAMSAPKSIDIPADKDALIIKMLSNTTLKNHAALQAALKSIENGRSSKYAYVIFIGHYALYQLGFPQCKDGRDDTVWECHIPVWVDELGITTELRVVVVPVGWVSVSIDSKVIAELDVYLSSHEILKKAIPNAVIIYDWLSSEEFTKRGSLFQRKLLALQKLSAALLDESYPNMVFLLDDSRDPINKQPESKIKRFEDEIKLWKLPRPVSFTIKEHLGVNNWYKNGYQLFETTAEFMFRSMEASILNNCEQGGDPMGQAIFKAYFADNYTPHWSIEPYSLQVLEDKDKIRQYMDLFSPLQNNTTGGPLQKREESICICEDIKNIIAELEKQGGLRDVLETAKKLQKDFPAFYKYKFCRMGMSILRCITYERM